MTNFREFRVLDKLSSYLRLLNAYNRDNFRDSNWRSILQSGLYTFGATMIIIANFSWIVLVAWYLFETHAEWRTCVIAVPIMVTILQLELIFDAMMVKNHTITETIDQVQRLVDRRKSFFCCCDT